MELKQWKDILAKRGYLYGFKEANEWTKANKEHYKEEHLCNSWQFIKYQAICSNDQNRLCEFKITILDYNIIQIECYPYRYSEWETVFHGTVMSEEKFDLLMNEFIGEVPNEYFDEQKE
jgi:hypothetical protein